MNRTAGITKGQTSRMSGERDRVRRMSCRVERLRLLRRAVHNRSIRWVDTLLTSNAPHSLLARWCADHEGFQEFAQRMLSRGSTEQESPDDSVGEANPLRLHWTSQQTTSREETADSNEESSKSDDLVTEAEKL